MDNLKGKGVDSRTTSEQREIAKNGGVASGAARRRKKAMRVASKILLDMPVTSEELLQEMEELGIPKEDATYQMAILVAMLNQAINGNVKAACFCRDIIGESPSDQMKREVLKLSKARFEHQKVMDEKAQDADRQKTPLAEIIQAAYEARLRKDRLAPALDGDGAQTVTEGV